MSSRGSAFGAPGIDLTHEPERLDVVGEVGFVPPAACGPLRKMRDRSVKARLRQVLPGEVDRRLSAAICR